MLLASHQRFPSEDVHEMDRMLRHYAGATHFDAEVSGSGSDFRFDVNMAQLKNVALVWSTCTLATKITYDAANYVRQIFPIRQHVVVDLDTGMSEKPNRYGRVVPAGTGWHLQNPAGFESLTLRIQADALERCLSAMIAEDCSGRLRFDAAESNDPRLARMMRNAVFNFVNDLDYSQQNLSAPALRELEQSLVVKFLLCNNHNFSDWLRREPAMPHDKNLSRAEEYIAANWQAPLEISQLAEVSNLSERSLFRAFRKRHGMSPYALIKRLRLERAREMIIRDAGEASIMSIASTCGFHSFGRFAAAYRETFGELPSQTMLGSRSKLPVRKPVRETKDGAT